MVDRYQLLEIEADGCVVIGRAGDNQKQACIRCEVLDWISHTKFQNGKA